MFLLLCEEDSVGLISAVHSHGYRAKKIAFFEHNSHLTDIIYVCDSCCYEGDLLGIEILKR